MFIECSILFIGELLHLDIKVKSNFKIETGPILSLSTRSLTNQLGLPKCILALFSSLIILDLINLAFDFIFFILNIFSYQTERPWFICSFFVYLVWALPLYIHWDYRRLSSHSRYLSCVECLETVGGCARKRYRQSRKSPSCWWEISNRLANFIET